MNLTHDQLATLARELLLCGHLIDRATMPHVLGAWDRETMRDVAIDEWMGASPIYTRRTQRLLDFEGDDVEVIFKGMQFDIGAPPQFMDFRYSVTDERHGEFWLNHCGALMDVEPMGPEYVFTMCHEIEDPTFDATAWATNPRARMRPIHRPPRVPADRHPHCAWTVTIDPGESPLPEPEMATLIAATRAAQLPLATIEPGETAAGDGVNDYAGPLVADIDFTAFSSATLGALCEEISLQQHLLVLAGLASVQGRFGEAAAREIGIHQLTGAAGVTAERLKAALGLGSAPEDLVALVRVHPMFRPRHYVSMDAVVEDGTVRIDLGDCPALHETPTQSWPMLLLGDTTPLEAVACAVDPTMRVTRIDQHRGVGASFRVTPGAPPARRHADVEFARFSTGAEFRFEEKGTPVRLRARRVLPAGRPARA